MNLAKLKELEQAATKGPWETGCELSRTTTTVFHQPRPNAMVRVARYDNDTYLPKGQDAANARLSAILRNLAPELIAVVEAARKALPYVERCPLEGSAPRFDELDAALTALHAKLAQETP